MSDLSFTVRDVYPNMGLIDTRTTVQPEAYDKVAFDEGEAEQRETVQAETSSDVSKGSIYKVLGAGVLVLLVLGLLS